MALHLLFHGNWKNPHLFRPANFVEFDIVKDPQVHPHAETASQDGYRNEQTVDCGLPGP